MSSGPSTGSGATPEWTKANAPHALRGWQGFTSALGVHLPTSIAASRRLLRSIERDLNRKSKV